MRALIALLAMTIAMPVMAAKTAWLEDFRLLIENARSDTVCKIYSGPDTLIIQKVNALMILPELLNHARVTVQVGTMFYHFTTTQVIIPDPVLDEYFVHEKTRFYVQTGQQICVILEASPTGGGLVSSARPIVTLSGTSNDRVTPPAPPSPPL